MEGSHVAFNARATFAWSADRLYCVYVRDDALYFIRIGGQDIGTAVAGQFGLLGALAGEALRKRAKGKRDARAAAQDRQDAQDLLAMHKDNFRLVPGEVLESSIEPPATFAAHGAHVGRWLMTLSDKKLSLQFEQFGDMQVALEHLPRFFGTRLKVNVQWNAAKKRYQKL